jgi:ATP-dependent RNA helicase DDX20
VRGLANAGFRIPSPVQRAAIPLGRLGADLVVQAKSGTGKTVTFGAILLDRVDRTLPHPQALVISPTREVALQSHAVIQTLAASLIDPPLRLHACLGGLPVAADRAALARGCHAVVGTPGRVRQLLEEGALRPDGIRAFVIDEADALMGGSFEADVLFAHSMLPERKQVMAFSATYPDAMRRRLESLMRRPEVVSASARGDTALRAVRQFYVDVDARPDPDDGEKNTTGNAGDVTAADGGIRTRDLPVDVMARKEEALLRVFGSVAFHQAVVFARRAAWGESLTRRLREAGYPALHLAGHLPQPRRMEVMRRVRAFEARVLVATDVAARGVDLERVNLVVHLDAPSDASTYAHRVGRTGRFGTAGLSVTIVTARELAGLRETLEAAEMERAEAEAAAAAAAEAESTRPNRAAADAGAGSTCPRSGPSPPPPPRPRLEPLPETVPADWYDYELDEADVANAERLRSGAFVFGEADENKTTSRRTAERDEGGDQRRNSPPRVSEEAEAEAAVADPGDPAMMSTWVGDDGGWASSEDGWTEARKLQRLREWASWWWWWWRDRREGGRGSEGRRAVEGTWIVPPVRESLARTRWAARGP